MQASYLETAKLRLLGDAEYGDLALLARRVQGGAAMGPGHTATRVLVGCRVHRVYYILG